jgi:hypothetical protein
VRDDGLDCYSDVKCIYANYEDALNDFEVIAEEYGAKISEEPYDEKDPYSKYAINSLNVWIILEKVQFVK